ncbi:MAG: MBOAT family O-acyltransferase [Leptospiraceae bacterium]|nr:MBOAT family O-acyltransferase [Leptospiraceae bacterium]
MLFNSLEFFVFILILFPIYFFSNLKVQRIILFLFSLYFYASLKIIFVPLIFFSFFTTYYFTKKLDSTDSNWKQFYLGIVLIVNLGLLALFKYTDFFRDAITDLGLSSSKYEKIGFVLPLGISFYTFQAIAYSIDVYRKKIQTENSFFNFSLFLLFFPQLVAGPIMRASNLLPQFEIEKKFNLENLKSGLLIMALGFFKKTIIADPIGDVIKPIYDSPEHFGGLTCFLALILFVVQIYCDFAGYSDIAIGIGKVLGFEIPINFLRPYLANSITDLWRRWHISLSTWLRDYVFISLGGSRVGNFRSYINVFFTMLVGGLWHGANWTFLVWGGINGLFLCIEKLFSDTRFGNYCAGLPRIIRTFYCVFIFAIGANFFRSKTLGDTLTSFKKMFTLQNGEVNTDLYSLNLVLPIIVLFGIEILEESQKLDSFKKFINWDFWKTPILIGLYTLCILIYTVISSPQFYYFQF